MEQDSNVLSFFDRELLSEQLWFRATVKMRRQIKQEADRLRRRPSDLMRAIVARYLLDQGYE